MDAVGTEGPHQVHREEGQPANDEAAHYDAQRLRRLRLHSYPLHLFVLFSFYFGHFFLRRGTKENLNVVNGVSCGQL